MRLTMSYRTRRELLVQMIPRYREADRNQKQCMLNEFVASTGYNRKYAIRLLSWIQVVSATFNISPKNT